MSQAPAAAASAGAALGAAAVGQDRRWRADIQAMRGLAVLLVVIDHAKLPIFPAGFLGVDIFFVISGFLMTGIIVDELSAGRFSFATFYARRARRLLPASYATILVTLLLAPILLDGFEFSNLVAQAAGAFSFTANVVLWRQVDYFNSDAALKPLLHTWSLSVEEQYYLVVPLLFALCPARLRWPANVLLVAASGLLCAYLTQRSPAASFYLLPTRAWELGVGSLSALAVRRADVRALTEAAPGWLTAALRLVCAAALILAPMLASAEGHPGAPAAIVCAATAFLLVAHGAAKRSAMLAPLGFVGDRSYSLYLVHWPVFAFANNIFLEPFGAWTTAVLLAICAAWTEAQYRLVEQPLRRMSFTPRNVAALALIPLAAIACGYGWARSAGEESTFRQGNQGLGAECVAKGPFKALPTCANAGRPETLIWGDSFAAHLVPGLAETTPNGIRQATQAVCGPFLGVAPLDGGQFSAAWARQCIAFNNAVLEHLRDHPEIRTVILSSALVQYLPGGENKPWRLVVDGPDGLAERPLDRRLALAALARTTEAIHALGRRAVLVAPPPSAGFDIGRCLDRLSSGAPTVTANPGCDFPRAKYEAARRPTLDFLSLVKDAGTVPILAFDDALCGGGTCRSAIGGTPIYRDGGHLSVEGSDRLAKMLDLGASAQRAAR